jgi:hypothetical protein
MDKERCVKVSLILAGIQCLCSSPCGRNVIQDGGLKISDLVKWIRTYCNRGIYSLRGHLGLRKVERNDDHSNSYGSLGSSWTRASKPQTVRPFAPEIRPKEQMFQHSGVKQMHTVRYLGNYGITQIFVQTPAISASLPKQLLNKV